MSAGISLLKNIPGVGQVVTYAPWVLFGLALAWGAVAQIGWEHCSAAAAKADAAAKQAVIDQKERDRVLGNQIAADVAEKNARTAETEIRYVERIKYVQSTAVCSGTPAMRAARDGLRSLGFGDQAGPAAGGDNGQAGAAAPRP